MATVHLTGGKTANVSEKKGQSILEWKASGRDKTSMVDFGTGKFIELGQIKGVDLDSVKPEEDHESLQAKKEREAYVKEWYADVERFKLQTIEEKAARMVDTGCLLLWKTRLNGGLKNEITGELRHELIDRLLRFFDQNPGEWWAAREVYQDLIPWSGARIKSNVKGIKSFGEAMVSKSF